MVHACIGDSLKITQIKSSWLWNLRCELSIVKMLESVQFSGRNQLSVKLGECQFIYLFFFSNFGGREGGGCRKYEGVGLMIGGAQKEV